MSFKNTLLSGSGSSLEWFDFALYGFFAPIFSQLFFPHTENHWLTLIAAYGVFAVGFLARPIGAILCGYLGDKYGRVLPLKVTPLVITLSTAIIAALPTYDSVGCLSIILLIAIRIIQGIFLGGEYSGNMVYLCERSPRWKYLWGSFASCAGSFGIILASAVTAIFYKIFDTTFMHHYGWRIAFLMSLPMGFLIFLVRRKITESPEFVFNPILNPLKEVAKKYKFSVFSGLGLIYLHATSYYFVFMFLPVFLTQKRHFSSGTALMNNTGCMLIHVFFVPIFALLVTFIGGLKALRISTSLFLLFSLPIFYFLEHGDNTIVSACLIALSIMTAFNASILPGLITELTPSYVRYTLLALVFNIGFGVFGGLTPTIGLLLSKNASVFSPGAYLTLSALITLMTTIMINNAK
ncbi:MAG: MFS transporter [Pseudomonadota bacterium]